MRATRYYGPGDICWGERLDPRIELPSDADAYRAMDERKSIKTLLVP